MIILLTNVSADQFLQSNKNTTFLSKNYLSLSLEISFYLAVHSYACGDVAQLLGQAFLAEVDVSEESLKYNNCFFVFFNKTCLVKKNMFCFFLKSFKIKKKVFSCEQISKF